MKKRAVLLIFTLIVSFPLLAFRIEVPKEAGQGGTITVYADETGVEIYLSLDDNIISKTETFEISVDGIDVFAGLLGVPSTATPGNYVIYGGGEEAEIKITESEFIQEDIALGSSMSSLRQSDDARKYEQWRILLEILKTVNNLHVYADEGFILPVEDYIRVSSFYGDRRRFIYDDGTTAGSIHNGIDYSAEPGTPVYAPADGKVVFAGERIISGNTVVVEHLPGVYSLYYHLNSLSAEEGQMKDAGDLIGTVGATGLATGAHLHWEVRVGGVAVNPETLVGSSMIDKDFIMSHIEAQ